MQRIQLEAAKTVNRVVHGGRNLTQVLSETLRRQSGFTPQERGALQDLCYGTLRYYSRLVCILDNLLERPMQDETLHSLLLVALYQLQYTKAGQHAIVDQAVRAAKSSFPSAGGLVNAILRNFQRKQAVLLATADLKEASRYAYQQWWIDVLKSQYGEQTEVILEAGNRHPPMTLRVNTRYTKATEYLELLASQNMAVRMVEPQALILEHPLAVDRLPKFAQGWVSVQDAGA